MAVSAAFDQSDAGNGVLPILQGRFSKSAQILSSVMPGHSRSKNGVLKTPMPGHPSSSQESWIAGSSPAMTINKSIEAIIMATHKLLLLPGDGIGTEVMAEVKRVIAWLNKNGTAKFETEDGLVGGSSYDADKVAITDATMARAQAADAVIFGAVGGPKWADVPYDARPEAGLLRLRKDMALFANLRPAICYPALADSSSLKRDVVEGLDIMIVRELTGGVYFGEPKTITDLGNGQKRAVDTQVYDTYEIERITRVAFELARKRRNKMTSMEKHNVMKSGVLWKEVVNQVHAREYKDVELEHQLADSGAMQLVRWPKQFDVIVTDNLFGDILSDIAAMLTGSLGMLPSASLGEVDPKTGKRKALYEPVHGSAPDIAGKGLANPVAMLTSFGMALRYSFDLQKEADLIDQAIAATLAKGLRTGDIKSEGSTVVSTSQMGEAIVKELDALTK
jgi:3-isopropylmalate dehydrogenase